MEAAQAMVQLAQRIDAQQASAAAQQLAGKPLSATQSAVAILVACAFPAYANRALADPASLPQPRAVSPAELRNESAAFWPAAASTSDVTSPASETALAASLRHFAGRQRLRIAVRELLAGEHGGGEVDETARELSELAEITISIALEEAERHVFARLGRPRNEAGEHGRLTVLGMGKLGGHELNAGSDVDLVCFYDSDDMVATSADGRRSNPHEVWTKVIQRMTATLDTPTEHGIVWRVDLRLRPEGSRGPLVNSLAAAERYYESYGRLWERAAMLRARPVAGDSAFGEQISAMLTPFIWRRSVDPSIASALYQMVHRARDEGVSGGELDLKLASGGIREAELFVQTLQLIWGGREARIRCRPTVEAAQRLLAAGLVTEREADDVASAYLALRRAEHIVQHASGIQTHRLPAAGEIRERLARALGHADGDAWLHALEAHMARVGELFASLLPAGEITPPSRWLAAFQALASGDRERFSACLIAAGLGAAADDPQLGRDLFETGRWPESPLGIRVHERYPHLPELVLDAVADAADPAQAARFLRGFCMRLRRPAIYSRLLADDAAAVRRLINALGASAFVGEVLAARPNLGELLLFERGAPSPVEIRAQVLSNLEHAAERDEEDWEARVGMLRRTKTRTTVQVALADLAQEITTDEACRALSGLADVQLEAATRLALAIPTHEPVRGLCVLAMGSLGARESGYGSDLDVIFLFDPAHGGADPGAFFSRRARRIIQLISAAHHQGRGYELDTRLRPSGNQGTLVVSLESFARYHGVPRPGDSAPTSSQRAAGQRAATWERLALMRARFAAGDARLGAQAMQLVRRAAFEPCGSVAEQAADAHRLRERMARELAKERPGRYDLKLGRGGLFEALLCVQLLLLQHGHRLEQPSSETQPNITALQQLGVLSTPQADALSQGYAFLRVLEQRIRVLHADASHLVEENAAGLVPLARRMGFRDRPGKPAATALMDRYRQMSDGIHACYQAIVAKADPPGA